MVAVIPGFVKMQKRLVALGYREITGQKGNFLFSENTKARGHEFHYSTYHPKGDFPFAYYTSGFAGTLKEGYMSNNLIAGYTHIHFASCLDLVDNWIKKCRDYRENI